MPSDACAERRFTLKNSATAHSDQSSLSVIWLYKMCRVSAQADLNLRSAPVSEGLISDVATHFYYLCLIYYVYMYIRLKNTTYVN